MEKSEKKNQRIALATSITVHTVVILLLFFLTAWRAPNPPHPEYGIELNFGLDTQGSGDVQPETPASVEQQDEQLPEEQESQPQKVVEEEVNNEKAVEEQPVAIEESPVVVKESKKEVKEPVKEKEAVKEAVTEEKKEEKKEVKVAAENNPNKPANQGDDKNKVGDKGNPEGALDAKALYGKQGGGAGGTGLELDGWQWDSKPNPILGNNESGRLVFEIKVDDSGEIISIKTLERSLSPAAEQICRREVEKLTFTQTGKNVPPISTGKITFVVRAQ